MHAMVSEAPFMSTTELENCANVCFRALDGSNYDARCTIAKLLGKLCAEALTAKAPAGEIKCLDSLHRHNQGTISTLFSQFQTLIWVICIGL